MENKKKWGFKDYFALWQLSLRELTPADLFPRTGHTECVELLVQEKTPEEKYRNYFMGRIVSDIMEEYGEQRDEWEPLGKL